MGIRYYGWAISPDEVTQAADDPWPVIRRADQRHDTPGWTNTYFDKAWPLMQRFFRPDPWPSLSLPTASNTPDPRPGYELVAGDVTYPYGYDAGYEPHVGVVTPDRVPAIARDVASVTPADLRQFSAGLRYSEERRRQDDLDYLSYYLKEAMEFTADAAARGHGIIYLIR